MTEKIPSSHRFEISNDPLSRERYRAIKEACKKLQGEFPHINLAFSLYGSLVKGKPLNEEIAKKTDIDLIVLFDQKDFKKSPEYRDLKEKVKNTRFPTCDPESRDLIGREKYVSWLFGKSLAERMRLILGALLTSETELDIMASPITRGGMLEHFTTKRVPFALFEGLDIGGKMFPYAQKYLRDIRYSPWREALMREIARFTMINERTRGAYNLEYDGVINKSGLSEAGVAQYPDTYKKAAHKYRVSKPKSRS